MRRFLLFILLFLSFSVAGQSLQKRLKTEDNIVLLTNRRCLVPLKRLDTLRLAVVSDFNVSPFIFSASRYAELYPQKDANLCFVLIENLSKFDKSKVKTPYIAIVFDTVGIQKVLYDAESVIVVFQKDSLALDYTAQLIFGAFAAHGVLPNALGNFDKGYGISTRGGIRFKYTIPQEVGLDSAYIFKKVDSIAESGIELQAYPGCQVFAAMDGKVIFYKSYGYHTYDRLIPVKNSDLYDLASVTKIAASVPALMMLYQQEKIDLTSTLGELCWCVRHSNKDTVKLIDALTHRAGLKPWIPFWKLTLNRHGQLKKKFFSTDSSRRYPLKVADGLYASYKTKKFIIRQIKKSELGHYGKYRYSDLSFYLYPFVVENLTGSDFEQYLNKTFYQKLGASLVYNPYRFYSKNRVVPTEYDSLFRKTLLWATVDDEGAAMMGGISGHAGLFANANDLAKVMQMFLNYGRYGGERFFADTTVKKWTSYQFAEEGNRRAIGFDKPLLERPERGTPSVHASSKSFGHSGFTGTFVWADPQTGLLFVFLSNRVHPDRGHKNLMRYNIRPNIHSVFYESMFKVKKN